MEVPDNWNWDKVWNVPLDEFMQIIDNSLEKGYTISWGTDVSEKGFSRTKGLGIVPEADLEGMQGTEAEKWGKLTQKEKDEALYKFDKPGRERTVTQELRQKGYDNYETTDDHGMVIMGTATDQAGNRYFKVQNRGTYARPTTGSGTSRGRSSSTRPLRSWSTRTHCPRRPPSGWVSNSGRSSPVKQADRTKRRNNSAERSDTAVRGTVPGRPPAGPFSGSNPAGTNC